MTTAYEQLMASLDERVKYLENRCDRLEADVIRAELGVPDKELALRLDAALRRIEQLEREVAVT